MLPPVPLNPQKNIKIGKKPKAAPIKRLEVDEIGRCGLLFSQRDACHQFDAPQISTKAYLVSVPRWRITLIY